MHWPKLLERLAESGIPFRLEYDADYGRQSARLVGGDRRHLLGRVCIDGGGLSLMRF